MTRAVLGVTDLTLLPCGTSVLNLQAANRRLLDGTIQLDRSCLMDLLSQELRPSLVTDGELARASLTPRLAKESAAQSLPSQLHRSGLGGTEGG